MTTRTFTDLVLEATQILKHVDEEKFADVIRLLLAEEQKTRKKTRAPRATRVDLVRDGKRVRGGKAFVNMHNEQIEYIELSAEDERALEANKKKAKRLFREARK